MTFEHIVLELQISTNVWTFNSFEVGFIFVKIGTQCWLDFICDICSVFDEHLKTGKWSYKAASPLQFYSEMQQQDIIL